MDRIRKQENKGDVQHHCAWCKKIWPDDPAEGSLFMGTYYNENMGRVMPIKAYLCDMHASECETGHWL